MSFQTLCHTVDPAAFRFHPPDIQNPKTVVTNTQAEETIANAANLLASDEVIAMPTETVYGLAANALSPAAIAKIYAAKNRPQDNPLIVHVSSLAMLEDILPGNQIPPIYLSVIKRFWPGPLTIILPKSDLIPSAITCHQPTVAVRFPSHSIARALITQCGFPLAAPSANSSGKPSPTLASHVMSDLNTKIPLVLDSGQCDFGIESTVLDALRHPPAILRPGGVTYEQLKEVPGLEALQVYKKHFVDKQLEILPTTPGMKYRHYSPEAQVVLFERTSDREDQIVKDCNINGGNSYDSPAVVVTSSLDHLLLSSIIHEMRQFMLVGKDRFGILWTSQSHQKINNSDLALSLPPKYTIVEHFLGSALQPEQVARDLFKSMREMDANGVDVIFVEGISEDREGLAVMNRLRKAASRIVTV
ncbi:DHBP synthase RibB-like alpha/beta domain-containing protein [Endogone sp. FLAS-F59071]|nr:DHBP synthase RibB-like alpha/beta domain-containing protein [Endogone sp. FLAS-F59071]|eukprot:RUS17665.1 DHBP synthase RibB-like alpha/beta domain-containing protein [Endogone sp. FLAS-F59071]